LGKEASRSSCCENRIGKFLSICYAHGIDNQDTGNHEITDWKIVFLPADRIQNACWHPSATLIMSIGMHTDINFISSACK
jgi:hypothetical protein